VRKKILSDTTPEMAVRQILEGLPAPLNSFISQAPIKTRYSIHTFIIDFKVANQIVIEVHGDHSAKWHTKSRQAKDEAKTNCLLEEGYQVLDIFGTKRQIEKMRDNIAYWIQNVTTNLDSYTYLECSPKGNKLYVGHTYDH
jgi:very-short-patch-repair endonuclease